MVVNSDIRGICQKADNIKDSAFMLSAKRPNVKRPNEKNLVAIGQMSECPKGE